jgi:mRNA interferase MazF
VEDSASDCRFVQEHTARPVPRNPTTTAPDNEYNPWASKLSIKIESTLDSWAVCNQPSTVAPSRFSQFKGKIPVLPKKDFNQVLELLVKWLPAPFKLEI